MSDVRVGIEVRGRPGMVVDRPTGSGDYVFVHFLEGASLQPGINLDVEAGHCIVYSPDCPTYIRAGEAGIFNNYLHVSTDLVRGILHRYPVMLNQVFLLHATEFIVPILAKIEREWLRRDEHWQDAIQLYLLELLLMLSRHRAAELPGARPRHEQTLKEVRFKVHSALQRPWTVRDMAALAGLGTSRFSALYAEQFGCPPMADLIRARIELAKFYLSNYHMPVSEVAGRCGFVDLAYFSRSFRRYTGGAPSRFR